jgi:hypothetical protein
MAKRIPGAPGRQYQVDDAELTAQERDLIAWADEDIRPAADHPGIRHGTDAAVEGRALLDAALGGPASAERAMGGRPPLDSASPRGQHAPVRQVRLPASMNAALSELAAAEGRRPSEIIREALAAYLDAHRAS